LLGERLMPVSSSNDPSLVAKALAKAQSVESRLNSLIAGTGPQPTVVYSGGTTVVTTSAGGSYTWTCPAGVTSVQVECWGAGAGGNGSGTSEGGPGGGGGEYTQEPAYPVVPGTVYNYIVGSGGAGGPAGNSGSDGGQSVFDSDVSGVIAVQGFANQGFFLGGNGGSGSIQTIEKPGGTGGGLNNQSTGGCGGGGSGGSTGAGGSGTSSVGATGTAGGAAGSGGGAAGGAGGNSAANGVNGSAPGGGGGGCGAAVTASLSKTYSLSGCRSYYGSDGSNPNNTRSINGTLWQGGTSASGGSFNCTQKCIMTFPTIPNITSDFSGFTATSCAIKLANEHTYYNSGMNVGVRTWQATGGAPPSWNGSSSSGGIGNFTIGEGATKTFSLGSSVGQGFINGTNFGIALVAGGGNLNNYWYGYFHGPGTQAPLLTITATSGATVTAGNGADGQVRLTYSTPVTSLVAAVQPAATTDAAGNQLAAGHTGPITAIDPVAANPNLLETWHHLTGATGWASSGNGYAGFYYRMNPDGFAEAVLDMSATTQASASVMISAGGILAAYCPGSNVNAGPVSIYGSGWPTGSSGPYLEVTTTGSVVYRNQGQGASTASFLVAGYIRWWPGTYPP
jgi:hypothetical protein